MKHLSHSSLLRLTVVVILVAGLLGSVLTTSKAEPVRIDVLIVYTPAVTEHYHGHPGILAHLLATFEGSNAAFDNSDIPIVLNMVHAAEVEYVESDSITTDLVRLREPDDGFMEEVHDLRDQFGADLVCLIRRGGAGGVSGRAFLINPLNPNSTTGFSVVSDVSAISNFVFAHEIGHNLGSVHDRADDIGSPDLSYSYGVRFTGTDGNDYRTIMATGSAYTRVAHFSNPHVLFAGVPTGVPIDDPEEADNSTAFAVAGPGLAAFRPEQSLSPTVLVDFPGTTVVAGSTAFLQPLVNGMSPLHLQWFQGEPGDFSQPLAGVSGMELAIPDVSAAVTYWLHIDNEDGVAQTRSVRVVVVDAPPEPYDQTVLQEESGSSGFSLAQRPLSQTFFFPGGYIDEIVVRLFRQGDPPPAQVELSILQGQTLYSGTIDSSAVNPWLTNVVVPVRAFVAAGEGLRLSIGPTGGEDSANRLLWGGVNGPENPDPGLGSADVAGWPDWAFLFTAQGREAWTFHTWLRAHQVPPARGQPGDALDGSGMVNHLRYALNLGPDDSPIPGIPLPGAVEGQGPAARLVFRFRERPHMADLVLVPRISTTLSQWDAVAPGDIAELPFDGEAFQYEVRVPIPPEGRLFIDLEAAWQP